MPPVRNQLFEELGEGSTELEAAQDRARLFEEVYGLAPGVIDRVYGDDNEDKPIQADIFMAQRRILLSLTRSPYHDHEARWGGQGIPSVATFLSNLAILDRKAEEAHAQPLKSWLSGYYVNGEHDGIVLAYWNREANGIYLRGRVVPFIYDVSINSMKAGNLADEQPHRTKFSEASLSGIAYPLVMEVDTGRHSLVFKVRGDRLERSLLLSQPHIHWKEDDRKCSTPLEVPQVDILHWPGNNRWTWLAR